MWCPQAKAAERAARAAKVAQTQLKKIEQLRRALEGGEANDKVWGWLECEGAVCVCVCVWICVCAILCAARVRRAERHHMT